MRMRVKLDRRMRALLDIVLAFVIIVSFLFFAALASAPGPFIFPYERVETALIGKSRSDVLRGLGEPDCGRPFPGIFLGNTGDVDETLFYSADSGNVKEVVGIELKDGRVVHTYRTLRFPWFYWSLGGMVFIGMIVDSVKKWKRKTPDSTGDPKQIPLSEQDC